MIEAGATFVARTFAGDINHLTDIIMQGVQHEGFSFIEVLQPAITYRKWAEYNEKIEYLEKEPETRFEAIKAANENHKYVLGVFYQNLRPVYHKELYENHNPNTKKLPRDKRLRKIREILKSK
jgi:2-oxoglutarate ferredoxin oxidoreductase subunit beta